MLCYAMLRYEARQRSAKEAGMIDAAFRMKALQQGYAMLCYAMLCYAML